MDIVSRAEAKACGLKHYFTGRPCKHGHIAPKFTSRGWCVECARLAMKDPKRKEYDKKYYKDNVDRIRIRTKNYIIRNSKRIIEQTNDWARRNPEKVRAIKHSYKARRRSKEAVGDNTKDISDWVSSQEKKCYWCGELCESSYHIDHYAPLSKGGTHTTDNLVISCPSCNLHKSAKDPYEFAQTVGRLF